MSTNCSISRTAGLSRAGSARLTSDASPRVSGLGGGATRSPRLGRAALAAGASGAPGDGLSADGAQCVSSVLHDMARFVAELPPTLSGRRVPVRVAREAIREDLLCCHAAPRAPLQHAAAASVLMAPLGSDATTPLPALQLDSKGDAAKAAEEAAEILSQQVPR